MSVLILGIAMAISASIEEAVDRYLERREWERNAPRRARRYTFN